MKIQSILFSLFLTCMPIISGMEKDTAITYTIGKMAGQNCIWAQNVEKTRTYGYVLFTKNKIDSLFVDKSDRTKGIGSQLFIHALNTIAQKKYSKACWLANESVAFYLPFGATIKGQPCKLIPTQRHFSANMEFDFNLNGDPLINKNKFKKMRITCEETSDAIILKANGKEFKRYEGMK